MLAHEGECVTGYSMVQQIIGYPGVNTQYNSNEQGTPMSFASLRTIVISDT